MDKTSDARNLFLGVQKNVFRASLVLYMHIRLMLSKKKIYRPSTNLNGVPLYAYGLFPKKTNQPQRTWNLSLSFCSKFSRWMPSCHQLSRSLRRWTILKSFLPAIKVFYFYIIHYMLRFVFKQNLIAPLAEVCKQDQTVPH